MAIIKEFKKPMNQEIQKLIASFSSLKTALETLISQTERVDGAIPFDDHMVKDLQIQFYMVNALVATSLKTPTTFTTQDEFKCLTDSEKTTLLEGISAGLNSLFSVERAPEDSWEVIQSKAFHQILESLFILNTNFGIIDMSIKKVA